MVPTGRGKAKVPQRKPRNRGAGGESAKDVKAYARLLADPCNAPFRMGMTGNGSGTNVQRFVSDFLAQSGATGTATTLCVIPTSGAIYHGFSSAGGANITFISGFTFPGSAKIGSASKWRVLSCCVEVMWTGSELNRQGHVAMGNVPLGAGGSPPTGLTPDELRGAMPYIAKLPDSAIGIKWRPNELDLAWRPSSGTGNETAIYLQVAGHPVNNDLRVRVTSVIEWEDNIQFGGGQVTTAYPTQAKDAQDIWAKSIALLDKSGHWLLTNAEALGHHVIDFAKLLM